MSPIVLVASIIGSAIRIYPEMRLIRFLLSKLGINEKQKVILTFFFALILDVALLAIFDYSKDQILLLLISDIISLLFFGYKDLNSRSLLNKITSHMAFRVIFGIAFFFALFLILMAVLPEFGVNDPYYLWSLCITVVYCYFGFWRGKRKKAPESAQSM